MAVKPNSGVAPLAIRPREALALVPIGKTKLNELIAAGILPSFRLGRARLIRLGDIEALVARLASGEALQPSPVPAHAEHGLLPGLHVEHAPAAPPRRRKRERQVLEPEVARHFSQFWQHYPRHVARAAAEAAFVQAIADGAQVSEIVHGAMAYAQATFASERRFVAFPGSWLRGQRWRDQHEPDPAPSGQVKPGRATWAGAFAKHLNQDAETDK